MSFSHIRRGLAFAALIAVAGCADDVGGRLPISGTIKLKGQPLDHGTINFSATEESGGGFAGALIEQGHYEIPAAQGLTPGVYQVRISAPEAGRPVQEAAPGESGPPAKDRVPPQFNANTTLEFEVKPGAINQFDFDVP